MSQDQVPVTATVHSLWTPMTSTNTLSGLLFHTCPVVISWHGRNVLVTINSYTVGHVVPPKNDWICHWKCITGTVYRCNPTKPIAGCHTWIEIWEGKQRWKLICTEEIGAVLFLTSKTLFLHSRDSQLNSVWNMEEETIAISVAKNLWILKAIQTGSDESLSSLPDYALFRHTLQQPCGL